VGVVGIGVNCKVEGVTQRRRIRAKSRQKKSSKSSGRSAFILNMNEGAPNKVHPAEEELSPEVEDDGRSLEVSFRPWDEVVKLRRLDQLTATLVMFRALLNQYGTIFSSLTPHFPNIPSFLGRQSFPSSHNFGNGSSSSSSSSKIQRPTRSGR
jgi:hypothetical protein